MAKKQTPNIDFMLSQAKAYADGTGYDLGFELDYGYELEKRYYSQVKPPNLRAAFPLPRCVVSVNDALASPLSTPLSGNEKSIPYLSTF